MEYYSIVEQKFFGEKKRIEKISQQFYAFMLDATTISKSGKRILKCVCVVKFVL